MTLSDEIKFCYRCGSPLGSEGVHGRTRPVCPSCGLIVFVDPKVVVAVLIAVDSRLVLIRRAIEPGIGLWSFPSGYVDRGEPLESAAAREVKEESGLDVELTGLVGLYSGDDDPVVLAVYTGEVRGGELSAGDETDDVGLFDPDALPELAFPRDHGIIRDWLARNSADPG